MAAETSSQAAIGGSFDCIRITLDTQKGADDITCDAKES